MVDDTNQHGAGAFSDTLAAQGIYYGIRATAIGYPDSKAVSKCYIVANTKTGATAATPDAPARLVGNGAGRQR
jgi:hypothetical protein